MLPRERVEAALEFRYVDIPPLEYHDSSAGLYEHGQALKEFWRRYEQDFNPYRDLPIPQPPPHSIDAAGNFHHTARDAWGTLWEYRIFGIQGHPLGRPLDNWADLPSYTPPVPPAVSGPEFDAARADVQSRRERYFVEAGWINVFEVMIGLRKFEDVLVDLALHVPEIDRLADIVMQTQLGYVDHLLALGVDAIQVADDWGTQTGLTVSRELWRSAFKPRYKLIVEKIHAAGCKAFYHTCGYAWDLLEDLADAGFDALWPQLPLYDEVELAAKCRDLRLALKLHPDRGHLMTHGRPDEVRQMVYRLYKNFQMLRGGSWFYVEM